MMTLADIGEAGLIARIKAQVRPGANVLQGIGDDAAVYDMGGGRALLVTTDTMVSGEHFLPDCMPMRLVGRKAMTSSVSDIVAMNGQPECAVIALSAPGDTSVQAIEELYAGLQEGAQKYGVDLVGGDTTCSGVLAISVTIAGHAPKAKVVYRGGARPGDMLCVTGTLGASQAGLRWLLSGRDVHDPVCQTVLKAHFDPHARLDLIQDWQARGVQPHALTDISDGLATEVHNVCEASRCGAVVDVSALPVCGDTWTVATLFGEDASEYALYWGEDYELVLALVDKDLAKLDHSTITAIGYFTASQEGVKVKHLDGSIADLPQLGWVHYSGQAP